MDVGTSGGIWGLAEGYSLMIGGKEQVYQRLEPIFKTLAPGEDRGLSYVGVLNHTIHHRGHLCVYLRLNDIPVPALYGPSGDEEA